MEKPPIQITGEAEMATYLLTPTVVIGLGQVGSEAVNCLKAQLRTLNVNLLHVIKGISVGAFLRPNPASNGENEDDEPSRAKPYNLWDASELSDQPSSDSVANEFSRKACFTQFVQGANDFKERLDQTFRELREERGTAVEAGLRLNDRYRVLLVGSLSDGVSSGLAVELPYFVQYIAPELGRGELSSDDLFTFYTLDEFDIPEDAGRSNAYAALKELSHAIDQGKYTHGELEVDGLPFKWCFLIDPAAGGLGIENSAQFADLLATMLSAILLSPLLEQFDPHQDDLLPLFGSMGVSFFSLPLRCIKEYTAKKQAKKLVDFLTSQRHEWNFNETERAQITDQVLDCLPKRDQMEKRLKTVSNEGGQKQMLDFSLSWEAYDDDPPFSELISQINALKRDYQERQREEFLLRIEQNAMTTVNAILDRIETQVDRYIQREPAGMAKAFTFLKQLYIAAEREKKNLSDFLAPAVDIHASRSLLLKSLSEYSTRFALTAKMLLPAIFLTTFVYNGFAAYLPPFVWGSIFGGLFFLILAVWGAERAYGKLENSVKLAKGKYISDLREVARTEIHANVQSRINEAYEQIQARVGVVEEAINSGNNTETIAGKVLAFRENLKPLHGQIDQIAISYQPSQTEIGLVDPLDTEAVEPFLGRFGRSADVPELLKSFLQSTPSPFENWRTWTETDSKNRFAPLWRFLKESNNYLEDVAIEDFIAQQIANPPFDLDAKVINAKDKSAPLINWTRELDFDQGLIELRAVISHSGHSKLPQKYSDILFGFDTLRCREHRRIYFCQALLHLPLTAIDGFSVEASHYRKAYEAICDKASLHTIDQWQRLDEIEPKKRRTD